MATGRFQLYDSALQEFFNGTQDWDTDDHYVVLLTSTYAPAASHDTLSDIVASEATGYDRKNLGGETVTVTNNITICDANDLNFGSNVTVTATFLAIVVGTVTGSAGTDRLVGYMYLSSDQTAVSVTNSNLGVSWSPTEGVFSIGSGLFSNANFGLSYNQFSEQGLKFAWRASPSQVWGRSSTTTSDVFAPSTAEIADEDDVSRLIDAGPDGFLVTDINGSTNPSWETTPPSGSGPSVIFEGSEYLEWETSSKSFSFLSNDTSDWTIIIRIAINHDIAVNTGTILSNRTSAGVGFDIDYVTDELQIGAYDGVAFDSLNYSWTSWVQDQVYTLAFRHTAGGATEIFIDDLAASVLSGTITRWHTGDSANSLTLGQLWTGIQTISAELKGIVISDQKLSPTQMEAFEAWIGGANSSSIDNFDLPNFTDTDAYWVPALFEPRPAESSDVTVSYGTGMTLAPEKGAGEIQNFEYAGTSAIPEVVNVDEAYWSITPLDLTRNVAGFTAAFVVRCDENLPATGENLWLSTTGPSSSLARAVIDFNNATGQMRIGGRILDADAFTGATSADGAFEQYKWHRVIGVWDFTNRTATLYLDGVQIAQTTTLGSSGSNTSDTDSNAQNYLRESAGGIGGTDMRTRAIYVWKEARADIGAIDAELSKLSEGGYLTATGTQFTTLTALYDAADASSLAPGQICYVEWSGDPHVADGKIVTVWDGTQFVPNPLTVTEFPTWLFTDWVDEASDAAHTLTLDAAGRPIVTMDQATAGYGAATLPDRYAGYYSTIYSRCKVEDADALTSFQRLGIGFCKNDMVLGATGFQPTFAFIGLTSTNQFESNNRLDGGTYDGAQYAGVKTHGATEECVFIYNISYDGDATRQAYATVGFSTGEKDAVVAVTSGADSLSNPLEASATLLKPLIIGNTTTIGTGTYALTMYSIKLQEFGIGSDPRTY